MYRHWGNRSDFNWIWTAENNWGVKSKECFWLLIDKRKTFRISSADDSWRTYSKCAWLFWKVDLAVALMESVFGNDKVCDTRYARVAGFSESLSCFSFSYLSDLKTPKQSKKHLTRCWNRWSKDTRIAEIRTQTEELTIDVKELKDLWKEQFLVAGNQSLNEECGVFGVWGQLMQLSWIFLVCIAGTASGRRRDCD